MSKASVKMNQLDAKNSSDKISNKKSKKSKKKSFITNAIQTCEKSECDDKDKLIKDESLDIENDMNLDNMNANGLSEKTTILTKILKSNDHLNNAIDYDSNHIKNEDLDQPIKPGKKYKIRRKLFRRRFFCKRKNSFKSKKTDGQDLKGIEIKSEKAFDNFGSEKEETCSVSSDSPLFDKPSAKKFKKYSLNEEVKVGENFEENSKESKNRAKNKRPKANSKDDEKIAFLKNGKKFLNKGMNTSKPYNVKEMFECYETDGSESEIKESNNEEEEEDDDDLDRKNDEYYKLSQEISKGMSSLGRDRTFKSGKNDLGASILSRALIFLIIGFISHQIHTFVNQS